MLISQTPLFGHYQWYVDELICDYSYKNYHVNASHMHTPMFVSIYIMVRGRADQRYNVSRSTLSNLHALYRSVPGKRPLPGKRPPSRFWPS